MTSITSPTHNSRIETGYVTVTGTIDEVQSNYYFWLVVQRKGSNTMWPKVQLPVGDFSKIIMERGDPGTIYFTIIQVPASVNSDLVEKAKTDTGCEIQQYIELDDVKIIKI